MPTLIIILGYLAGSAPSAYVAGRLFAGIDIRQVGDRNMGAANAFHEIGPAAGITVAIIDVAKGTAPVLIARAIDSSLIVTMLTGLAAVAGHNFPVFLGFRGGRGLATSIGVLLVIAIAPVIVCGIPAVIAFIIWRSITVSAAFLFVPLSLICWLFGLPGQIIAYSILLPCVVALTHLIRARKSEIHV